MQIFNKAHFLKMVSDIKAAVHLENENLYSKTELQLFDRLSSLKEIVGKDSNRVQL